MKRLQLLPLLGILLIISCAEHKPQEEETPVVPAPNTIISVQEAENLFTNYKENRIGLIEEFENQDLGDGETPFMSTTSLTFDFDTMKQYMEYVEQQADSAGVKIEGLRVYLGQYAYDPSAKYPGAETVYFNPTMKLASGDEVSFAIQDVKGKPTAVSVGEILGKTKAAGRANLTLPLQPGVTSLAGNDGTRRPPPMNDDNDY